MSTILGIPRVAQPMLAAILLAAGSGCAGPTFRAAIIPAGYDAQQVSFSNPGPHQIDVYSVAPDTKGKGASPKIVHLVIYLDKQTDHGKEHHFKVNHDPAHDEDVN